MRAIVVLVLLLAGCATEPVAHSNEPPVTSGVVIKQIPVAVNRRLDVLLVIDNSAAMAPYQVRLATNVRRFVDALRATPGGLPNLRLAVTTTCDDGRLREDPALIGNFVVDHVGLDGVRLRNYRDDLADIVARIADVGTAGCAEPKPLTATRRALERYENRSFLRESSFLGVVWITAHDEPSAIAGYEAAFLRSVYDPYRVHVGGVLGFESGVVHDVLAAFPNRSSVAALDDEDWSSAFVQPAIRTTLGAPCMETLLDVDPAPGNQYACAVWYDFPIGGPVVPSCDDSDGMCWRIVEDRAACVDGAGRVEIANPPDMPEWAMLNLECLSR